MTTPREETEAPEVAPVSTKPRLSIVVILAILLGSVLTLLVGGTFLYFQQRSALQDEARVAKDALKEKSQALGEMKAQIEALSRQMYSLKEYALARSGAEGEKKKENALPEVLVPAVGSATVAKAAGNKETAKLPVAPVAAPAPASKPASAPEPAPAVVKKATPEVQNCGLVGKSAEEQAATLRRCVMLMDSPSEKPRKP